MTSLSHANDPSDQAPADYRRPPRNLDAEQALLGAILVNNDAAQKVTGFLEPGHFYEPVHGRIYESILKLVDRGQSADPIRLKPFFESDEALKNVGGAGYLVRLAGAAATIINAEDYGRTIYDLALRRSLIAIGEEMVNTAYDADVDHSATTQIEDSEKRLFDLAESGEIDGGFQAFSVSATQALNNIESAYRDEGNLSGVTTGLRALNEHFGGLHNSDLVILAGRPAMGKTALATNIAFNAARLWYEDQVAERSLETSKGAVVGFFSLEMSADQLAARILAERADIPSNRLRRGQIDQSQFNALSRAVQEIEEVPLFIDDTPALTIAGLRSRARRLKRQKGLGLVVVDYLQLLRGTGRQGAENRVLELSEITRGLKSLAKELNVPVLALSQLSRAVEQRENKRPMLADLRESGSIEQVADMVLFVFREEYYKQKEEPRDGTEEHKQWEAEMQELLGQAEVIIGKQRHGPTGTARLHFDAEVTRFFDRAHESALPERM